MKNDRKTKDELIEELESVRRKAKKLERLLEKQKHAEPDITKNRQFQEGTEASEEHYRLAFEPSHEGLLLVNRSKGAILDSNAYAQELLDYSKEEFLKNNLWGVGVVKDDKDFQEALSRLERDGVIYYDNISVKNKAGILVNTEVILVDKEKFIQCNIRDNTERKRAEVTLRESEDRYRNLVELSPDPIFVHSDGNIVFVNSAALKLFGAKAPEEIIGKSALDFVHPDYREFALRRIQKIYSEGLQSTTAEEKFIRFDGTTIDVEVSSIPCTFSGRKAVQGVIRDITERKRAEEELRKSEERFKLIFEYAPDAFYLSDLKGNFIAGNKAAENITGYKREELIGSNFLKLNLLSLDQLPKAATLLANSLTGKPTGPDEFILKRKTGDKIPVEIITHPVPFENKTLILGIARDITERKRTEKQIALLAHTLKSVAECVSITDMNDIVLFVNNAFLKAYGFTEQEILGKNINILRSPNNPPSVAKGILAATLSGGWSGELMNRTKDGRDFPVSLSTSFVRDEQGQDIALVGIATNITERKRAEVELKKSEEKYRSIFENVQDVYYEASLDGTILEVSPSIEIISRGQYNPADLIGKSIYEFYPDTKDNDTFLAAIQITSSVNDFKVRFKNRDGSFIPCSISAKIKLDAEGRPEKIIGSMHDISKSKQAEEALKKSEELLKSIFTSTPDSIIVTDINGRITLANQAAADIRDISSPEQLVGKSFYDLIAVEERHQAEESMKKVMTLGFVKDIEFTGLKGDNERFTGELSISVLKDSAGSTSGFVGVAKDITERKRIEDNVRKLSRAVEQSPASVMITDTKGDIEYVNPKFTHVTGYTIEEVRGKNPRILKSGYTRNEEYSRLWEMIQSGKEWHGEFQNKKKNGELYWESASLSPIFNENGTVTHFLAVKEDITERKLAEQLVRESEEHFRAIFDQAPIAIALLDTQGRPIVSNKPLSKMVGYSTDELANMKFTDFTYPDDIENDLNQFTELIEGNISEYSMEKRFVHKNGNLIWVNLFVTMLRGESGKPKEIIGMAEDITDRKRVTEALQESELRFRSLYENTTIGIYRTTPDGKILLANPAILKMLGYTSFEKLAERNLEQDGFDSSSQRKEFLKKIERDGEVSGHESQWICQDGTPIYVLESARAIRDSNGKTLYYDGTVENITEHKSMQNQILQAQKVQSIGTLAGGIAHDFNNILGIILAYTSVLERSELDKGKISKSTDAITQAVNRGSALVRQILTFARQTGAAMKSISIPVLIQELLVMLKETFPPVIEFQTDIAQNIPLINADNSQMHQVFLNLCVNARDAMPKGGILRMEVKTVPSATLIQQFPEAKNDSYISISVSDTGIGMDDATKNRIFDPFFTTKELGKGTGLGLSVVYGVIQDHHGFISVETKVGHGTTFHLYFPVPQEKAKIQDAQNIRTEDMQLGTETILFVEDEELLREVVQSTLESNGYKVLLATNGREGIEIYRTQHKDIALVLCDMGLPKLGGLDVYAMLKEINPNIKIIFASGFISLETRSELFKTGVKGIIQKPYGIHEVLQMVRDVLDEK